MTGYAIGGVLLAVLALVYSHWAVYRLGGKDAVGRYERDRAERRALRRTEMRQSPYAGRHQVAPWPGPEPDQLATTDELRALSYAAETGDLAEVRRGNAAFFRTFALQEWARKRTGAA